MRIRWIVTRLLASALVALLALLGAAPLVGGALSRRDLGRSEVRVRSAPFPISRGRTVRELALPARLEALGYRRVHERPREPGEYFWGYDVVWIYRRAHRVAGEDLDARLLRLDLDREGRVSAVSDGGGRPLPFRTEGLWLEPATLATSLVDERPPSPDVTVAELPGHVWRAVLAAEDHRFFDHPGVDPRSVARALVRNLQAGEVVEGGSTITQQLVKNRDLTSRRTLFRKVREGLRSLALELSNDKERILGVYLSDVYLGHVDGVAIHGLRAGARAYFGARGRDLDLGQAATLAGIIRSPNRLSPLRHPKEAQRRRDAVLTRMEELEWVDPATADRFRRRPLGTRSRAPTPPPAPGFRGWVAETVADLAPHRMDEHRGLVVETTLDPHLQAVADAAIDEGLARLRRNGRPGLEAALVALEADTGRVLAWVGGSAGALGTFDRIRQARRQPGSVVKPLLLLEAFEECDGDPLHPARRISNRPLRLDVPTGVWRPTNADGSASAEITVRDALRSSLNFPFVRIARHCGLAGTAARLTEAGLPLPPRPPPSFALGSVEASPLEIATAYATIAGGGRWHDPVGVARVERPGGWRLAEPRVRTRRVVGEGTAFLVADLMRSAVADGTASRAGIQDLPVAAKTGTSSDGRDAWLAGFVGDLVVVVWVGRDDGRPARVSGASAAAPIWRRFVEAAAGSRPPVRVEPPPSIVRREIDGETGLLVRSWNPRSREELFRGDALPPRDRFWRRDEPVPAIE